MLARGDTSSIRRSRAHSRVTHSGFPHATRHSFTHLSWFTIRATSWASVSRRYAGIRRCAAIVFVASPFRASRLRVDRHYLYERNYDGVQDGRELKRSWPPPNGPASRGISPRLPCRLRIRAFSSTALSNHERYRQSTPRATGHPRSDAPSALSASPPTASCDSWLPLPSSEGEPSSTCSHSSPIHRQSGRELYASASAS